MVGRFLIDLHIVIFLPYTINMKKIIIGILVVVVAVGGWYAWKMKAQTNEGVACTMEALQCPGGTYVGRGGPSCAFAACPTAEFFTGTLRQDSNGFNLLMDAPAENGGMEVAYSMPLEIKVSNVLGQLVGRRVKAYGTFSTGNTLVVDHLEELTGTAGDSSVADVGVGKTVFINGVRVTLNSLVQDSRCPVDAQCMEAGAVTANVTFQSNTDKVTQNMASDEVPLSFDSYKISIEGIKPPRYSKKEPTPSSYVLTFKVVPAR